MATHTQPAVPEQAHKASSMQDEITGSGVSKTQGKEASLDITYTQPVF